MLLLLLILAAMIALCVFACVDYRRWWRDAYMVEPSSDEMAPRKSPNSTALAPWLIGSLGIAILSFLTGLFGPGGVAGPNRYVTVLLLASLALSLLWVVVVVAALVILRWRACWLLIGAVGALCWPTVFVLLLVAISQCQPGCLPEVD